MKKCTIIPTRVAILALLSISCSAISNLMAGPQNPQPGGLQPQSTQPAPTAEVGSPTPMSTPTPAATLIPLTWKRISNGLEFPRDTVTGIAVDKNDLDVIYVGMKNTGIYKSIDGGLSWSPKYQGLVNTHVESLTIDPQDPKILYAGTMGGIFKTQDGGENWERIGEGYRLLMDPQNSSHLYAQNGEWGALSESIDQGGTWEEHKSPCPQLWSWAIDPQDGMTIFGSTWDNDPSCSKMGLYKSSDGGRTWTFLGLAGQRIGSVAVGEDEQGNALIYADGDQGDYISEDGGKSWVQEPSLDCRFLPVEPDSPDTVYCSDLQSNVVIFTAGKVSRTISIGSPPNINIAALHADNYQGTQRLIAGGQGVYISTDNGKSWSPRSGGLGAARMELKIDPANNKRMYLASYLATDEQDCVLFRSDDSGKNWKQIMKGGHVSWCGPTFDPANALYLLKDGFLEKSTDNGDTWISSSLPSGTNFGMVSANPYLTGFLYAGSHGLFYSTDDGNSWQKATYNPSNDYYNGRFYYAKGGNLIYSNNSSYSTDSGKDWIDCGNGSNTAISDSQLVIDPSNNQHLYLAANGDGILISDDGCHNWQPNNRGLGNLFVKSIALDPNNPNTIYAGTNDGAYTSYDRGQTWGQVNDGLPGPMMVYSIEIDSQSNVYAATPFGIFKLENK